MTVTASTAPPTDAVDLFGEDILSDSLPTYTRLRELAPVVHLPERDLWAITRYDGVRAALGDPASFSSTSVAFNATMNQILTGTSLATDPPDHQQLRAALTENLTPRAVRGMGEQIRTKAETLVDELVERGSFDGMDDLARPFVISIVMDLIGVQGDVREKLLAWGEAAFNMQGPENDRMRASLPVAGEMFTWTHEELRAEDLTEGSIGRAVFEAGERGAIAPESCGLIVHQYIAAGMDTTITAIGNAILLLGRHPEQFAALRVDPSLVPSAFAEVQRFLPPIPVLGRGTTTDVDVDGLTVPGASQVALLVAAGNRDPRHYDEPETFDITRNPTDHLTFGYGTHGCAGQGLARLEAHTLIETLARRISSFEVADATRRINNITRPFASIEVVDVRAA